MNDLCAVVLAAGIGRRFTASVGVGASKLLAPCVGLDGSQGPVLGHALRAFDGWQGERLLVVRHDCRALIALGAEYGFESLVVRSAGMGDSLSAAVRSRPDAAGWLITLGDMPWVRPHTLQDIAAGVSGDRACVPVYQGKRGHPVGFPSNYGKALSTLQGDEGARRLLREGGVTWLEVDDPGVLRDVDVPEDLAL